MTGRFNAYAPPPLDAEFTWSCSGLACDFDASATSGRGKKSYDWDFDASDGIGVDATGQAVSHSYGAPGTFSVTLTASTNSENDSQKHDVTVSGGGANNPPTASFSVSCSGVTCSFTDTSTDSDGTISSWGWDFGDTNVASSQNPTHKYHIGGTYNVSLTVTDNDGDADTANQLISPECLSTERCSQPVPIGVSMVIKT